MSYEQQSCIPTSTCDNVILIARDPSRFSINLLLGSGVVITLLNSIHPKKVMCFHLQLIGYLMIFF